MQQPVDPETFAALASFGRLIAQDGLALPDHLWALRAQG